MKWKVLVSAPYMQPVIDRFRPELASRGVEVVVPPVRERMEEDDLLQWIGDMDGVISGDDRFTERVLKAAPKLKVISKWGTGIDSIDSEAAARLGIVVRRTPNAFSEPVADTVLGYMLCFARNLVAMDRAMKGGEWKKIPGRTLAECTLGVIGVGDCGKAVIRRAKALGMTILGNDIKDVDPAFVAAHGARMVSKEELLAEADFVSLNTDLNPTSRHLMNEERFALMKPTAVLVNASRGPVVDERALIRALQSGKIAGAAMDVFEDEPLPADSPLKGMDNVFLAPHNANSSPRAWENIHRSTIEHLMEELERRGA
ncbi:MAG: phosphoglycerate dehydrogenase [Desulfovibrionaceae bacterium]|uniref:phosphoglycerate dehydrogenase n=1 Tax=Desulfovibrio aminophilus TaxID=81425 RepID=UPI0039EB918E